MNRTDRGLSQNEERRRYTLKSGLQSLLVERFGDQLRARPESEDLVILEHVSGQRDACHAPLSALSDEARSWVRWQVDAADEPQAAATAPQAASVSPTVLEDAQRALEEYDYPLAEQLLRGAFAASLGRATEALALLELLVEHLAMDEETLALESGLDRGERKHPRVRGLLAMAAARLGRLGVASRLVEGLSGPAEVYAELSRQALAQDQLDVAESCLGHLRDADPAHPALKRLSADLDSRRQADRAAERRPVEAELERLLEQERWGLLLQRATAVQKCFPGSAVAGSCRVRAEQALAAQQIGELTAEADQAEERGDLAAAVGKLEQAERLGADLRHRLGALRKAAALARSGKAVERVRSLLPGREGASGLGGAVQAGPRHLRGALPGPGGAAAHRRQEARRRRRCLAGLGVPGRVDAGLEAARAPEALLRPAGAQPMARAAQPAALGGEPAPARTPARSQGPGGCPTGRGRGGPL